MASFVIPPDLELFAIRYFYEKLESCGRVCIVTNREPSNMTIEDTKPVVVLKDQGGPTIETVTFSRSLGVTVYAGARQDEKSARDLAFLVYGFGSSLDIVDYDESPVAAVNFNGGDIGPYRDPESADRSAYYMSFQYCVTGTIVAG